MKSRFKVGDFVIIALVALCALGVLLTCKYYIFSNKGTKLEVRSEEGTSIYSMLNPESFTIKSHNYTMKVEITPAGVYVSECNCPDRICVNTGKIEKTGESIVCVPAGVSLTVIGDKGEYDIVGG